MWYYVIRSLCSGWFSGNIYNLIYKSHHFPKWDDFIPNLLSLPRFQPTLRSPWAQWELLHFGFVFKGPSMTLFRERNSEQLRETEETHYLLGSNIPYWLLDNKWKPVPSLGDLEVLIRKNPRKPCQKVVIHWQIVWPNPAKVTDRPQESLRNWRGGTIHLRWQWDLEAWCPCLSCLWLVVM